MVAKFKATDRKLLTEGPIGDGSDPIGMSFDGANVWVVNKGNSSISIK